LPIASKQTPKMGRCSSSLASKGTSRPVGRATVFPIKTPKPRNSVSRITGARYLRAPQFAVEAGEIEIGADFPEPGKRSPVVQIEPEDIVASADRGR